MLYNICIYNVMQQTISYNLNLCHVTVELVM